MIDFGKELGSILKDDPLGLLTIKPKDSSAMSSNERLIASFEEINSFMREQEREPAGSRDIKERKLFSRLKGLRDNPENAAALREYDIFGLLGEVAEDTPVEINTISDVLEYDALGLLGDSEAGEADPGNIFQLTHVPKSIDKPDYVAKRKKCTEFEEFENLFKKVHAELIVKKKTAVPFTSELQIKKGEFFILDGMLVLVANVGKRERRNFGNTNARLYCVFENGTESSMLLRSLAAALWKDANSRHVQDVEQMELFKYAEQTSEDDKATGYIYVLRSLSEAPQIKEVENLYKIGFSTKPIAQRLQNADKEPTYLMSDVKPVTEYKTYNLNPHKLEQLLHTFFAGSCLELDVFDNEGKRHTPREWFDVPLNVIETAVHLLINGEIVNYRYDSKRQEIVSK